MTTPHRCESAPNRADVERIVVGPTLFTVVSGPTARQRPANALYVVPDEGAVMLGSGGSPPGIREVIERGVHRRRPEAIWLRDVPWFVDAWGVRTTGRLERSLAEVAAGSEITFVSWLGGDDCGGAVRPSGQSAMDDPGITPRHEQ